MEMRKHKITISLVAFCLLAPITSAQAAIKCWVNKDKVRECGQAVPPEYAQQRIEIINSKGIVIKVIERTKTPEELAEFRRQEEIRKAKELEIAAKKRKDLVLLQTYTNEDDLLLARKQNLRAVEGIIDVTNSNTKILKQNLNTLEKQAADAERAGQQPSKDLVKEMDNLKRQIKDNQEFIDKKMVAKKETEAKFDADLNRFRELKGVKAKKVRPK